MTNLVETPTPSLVPLTDADDAARTEQIAESARTTGEMTSDVSPVKHVDEFVSRISAAWHKYRDSIVNLAEICAQANSKLKKEEKEILLRRLPFKKSTFSKLVKIGNDPRLRDEQIKRLLPANFSAMHLVSSLSDDELTAVRRDGILIPAMKRAALTDWIAESRGKARPNSDQSGPYCPDDFHAAISVSIKDEQALSAVEALLEQMNEIEGVSVIKPRDTRSLRLARSGEKQLKTLRKLAEKLVNGKVAARFKNEKQNKETRADFLKRVDWDEAQLQIGPDANENRIKEVLAFIGSEDQLEVLKRTAEEKEQNALQKVAMTTDNRSSNALVSDDRGGGSEPACDGQMASHSTSPTVF